MDMERKVMDSLFRYIRWVTVVKGIRQFLGDSRRFLSEGLILELC